MGDLWCDTLEFKVSRATLSAQVYPYQAEQVKAVLATAGIELMDYQYYLAHPVPGGDEVLIVLRSGAWVRKYLGRRQT